MRRMTFDDRRAELIEAAIRVIARDGLAAATTRAIVGEAGMPQGSLFYIFASREALISAVIDHITDQERIAALLSVEMIVDGNSSIESVLLATMDSYLRMLEREPDRELALLEVATHALRHDRAAVQRQWSTYRSAVTAGLNFVAQTMKLRWVLPVDDLAHLVTSSLDGITLSWLTDRDTNAARRDIAVLAKTFAALDVPETGDDAHQTAIHSTNRGNRETTR